VRLVVGAERPSQPHEQRREETRLKPVGEPSTIVLTQYTEADASRYGVPAPNYGAPAGGAQPLATTPTPQTFDPYLQPPPSSVSTPAPSTAPVRDWNTGTGAATTPTSVASNPFQRIGTEIQTATQPLQDGVERVGDSVRNLGNNIAGRADQLRDSLGRPLQNGLLGAGSGQTTATTTSGGPGVAAEWNGNPTLPMTPPPTTQPPTTQPLNTPPAATTSGTTDPNGSNWNSDATTAPGIGGAGGGPSTAPPYAGAGGAPAANNDRWANAADPRLRTDAGSAAPPATGGNFGSPSGMSGQGGLGAPGGNGSTPSGLGNSGGFGAAGSGNGTTWGGGQGNTLALPDSPSLTNASGGFGQNGPLLGGPNGGVTTTTGAPEVRGWMLGQAGDRSLDGGGTTPLAAGSQPLGGLGAAGSSLGNGNATGAANPGGSLLGSPSWATGQPGPATTPVSGAAPGGANPAGANPAGTAQPDGRHQAAVVLAWVLLFASVAGNMYLFWSYLDVRTKYRALVRKTARAVGSRFSAA
jgi:hypothetical protein